MNGPFNAGPDPVATVEPAELDILAPTPLLLPGESREEYDGLRQMILADLAPQSAIEWLLASDVAELTWEIRRYRLLRHKLLDRFRQKAIEASLRSIDLVAIPEQLKETAERYTVENALNWRFDPIAANEIEARLSAYGCDRHSVSMEVYLQAREQYLFFEALINSAYCHRGSLLRELSNLRCREAFGSGRRAKSRSAVIERDLIVGR